VQTTFGSTAMGVLGMIGARAGLFSDVDAGPCFSLVACSWLFDMSWAAYYDPVSTKEQVKVAMASAYRRFEEERARKVENGDKDVK